MLIRAFLWGNDLKAFLLLKSAIFAFPHECHKKPTTATTTWNSKQKLKSAIFCFFSHSFSEKPCISSLAALERHLKRNDRCDRKTQKKMSEKGATKRWRNENFPSVPGTANKFNSRLYDNIHQHNTDLVEITLRSRLNPHHFGGLVGIYGSLHGRWSHIGNCEVHLRHHHFHSFYGGTDWNIHLVINTLKYKRYEQKHWSDTYMGSLLHHQWLK